MATLKRRLAQKGVSLLVGTASMALLIPSGGLAIDAALLYYTKARIQGAVDGAALAAARSLSLGSTTTAQAASAKQNAVNWFYANFPNTLWGTSNTQMDQSMVQVFDDPNNPNLRNVTVAANTTVPTIFMRWFHMNSTVVAALGNASRRDAVMMMVLDRSGSMGSSCPDLRTAAKIFTGQFAEGRDRIGLITFSDNVTMQQAPTTDFQTILGYSNNYGTGTGLIDSINCTGGTNTASAVSIAYNELYKVNLPGALNLIVFETDGLPNTVTLNMWDSASNAAGIANSSNCRDRSGIKKGSGGFATAVRGSLLAGQRQYADLLHGIRKLPTRYSRGNDRRLGWYRHRQHVLSNVQGLQQHSHHVCQRHVDVGDSVVLQWYRCHLRYPGRSVDSQDRRVRK